MYFFTGDQHFGHDNIRGFCARPFETVEEMDTALIDAWNSVVGIEDTVYHLGDLTLGSNVSDYLARLNGQVVILEYPFHHDKRWLRKYNGYPTRSGPLILAEQIVLVEKLCFLT